MAVMTSPDQKVEVYSPVSSQNDYLPDFTHSSLVIGPVHSSTFSTPRAAYARLPYNLSQRRFTDTITVQPGTHSLLGRDSAKCK